MNYGKMLRMKREILDLSIKELSELPECHYTAKHIGVIESGANKTISPAMRDLNKLLDDRIKFKKTFLRNKAYTKSAEYMELVSIIDSL